jgi:hypothetical protein
MLQGIVAAMTTVTLAPTSVFQVQRLDNPKVNNTSRDPTIDEDPIRGARPIPGSIPMQDRLRATVGRRR